MKSLVTKIKTVTSTADFEIFDQLVGTKIYNDGVKITNPYGGPWKLLHTIQEQIKKELTDG